MGADIPVPVLEFKNADSEAHTRCRSKLPLWTFCQGCVDGGYFFEFLELGRYTIYCLLCIYCMCIISLPHYFAFSAHNNCIFFHFCILFRSLICSFYHNLQFLSSVFTFCHLSPLGLSYLIYEAFLIALLLSLSLSLQQILLKSHILIGGGGWSYLISRAFFIICLNFLSWFRNPLKSCRDIKNSFQLFQAYIKTSDLYISLSFYFSFFFGFLVLLCMIVYILRYPFLYRIYLCILWIYFFSLSLCTPFSFFKIIFPSFSLLYIFTFLL